MTDLQKFSAYVSYLRDRLSHEEISELIKVPVPYLKAIEKGEQVSMDIPFRLGALAGILQTLALPQGGSDRRGVLAEMRRVLLRRLPTTREEPPDLREYPITEDHWRGDSWMSAEQWGVLDSDFRFGLVRYWLQQEPSKEQADRILWGVYNWPDGEDIELVLDYVISVVDRWPDALKGRPCVYASTFVEAFENIRTAQVSVG